MKMTNLMAWTAASGTRGDAQEGQPSARPPATAASLTVTRSTSGGRRMRGRGERAARAAQREADGESRPTAQQTPDPSAAAPAGSQPSWRATGNLDDRTGALDGADPVGDASA